MGQVVGSLYYLDPTVIPRLKSLRSGDDPVFSFGVLFYPLKRNPRGVIQHINNAAPFKSVFLDQMLHDLIVRMRIDAQVRDLCPAVIDDLEKNPWIVPSEATWWIVPYGASESQEPSSICRYVGSSPMMKANAPCSVPFSSRTKSCLSRILL